MARRNQFAPPNISQAFESIKSDYSAAKSSRFRRTRIGISSMGSGADYHIRNEGDFLRIMELARDMDRNDVIVGQTVDRAAMNTIQGGFTLQMHTGDTEVDAEIERRFRDWADDPNLCDAAGRMTFNLMQYYAFRHTLVDGDCIVLGTKGGQLQMHEAHRMRTPRNTTRNVIHGVLVDSMGRHKEYWLTKKELDPYTILNKVEDIVAIPAYDKEGYRQVFHVVNPKRISQTRGVSAFAPIIDTLGMIEDINFAKMLQQQIVSCFAIIRERVPEFGGGVPGSYGDTTTETLADNTTRTLDGIAPGMEIYGAPGETIKGFSPQVPNPEFFPHIRLMIQFVGINLGLPLVLVMLDASETNFSGWRGAVDQARIGFRHNQQSLITNFHRPITIWKIRQFMAEDAVLRSQSAAGKINIFAHRWQPPAWPYIQPYDDAKADALQASANQNSLRRIYAERGLDFQEIVPEIVEDRAAIIEAAIARAKSFPEDAGVSWRDLAGGMFVETANAGSAQQQSDAQDIAREVQREAKKNG